MGAATEDEQRFLLGLLTGEVRQGALDAVAVEGLAQATGAPPGGRTAGGDARGLPPDGGPGAARGRPRRPGPLPPHGRPPRAADAGAQRLLGGRGGGQARRLRGRGEAGRHPRPGAPGRRHGTALHPHPGRHHRPPARSDGRRAGVEGRAVHPGRRGDLLRRGRASPLVPGDRGTGRLPHGRGDGGRRRSPSPPSSSTRCPSTAATCSTCRSPSGTRSWPGWSPSRCGCGARWCPGPTDVRGGGGVPRRDPGARPRGRRRQGARRRLQRGPARRVLAEGQARPHARPGGAGRRVGPRPPHRQALQPPPRRPHGRRRLRHARQDLQGHDGRDAGLADRTAPANSPSRTTAGA